MDTIQKKPEQTKQKFHLYQRPWLAMVALIVVTMLSILLIGILIYGILGLPDYKPMVQFAQGISYHFLIIFILIPLLLKLPKGKRTYKQYLDDIGLSRMQPFFALILLALSSYLILALSQVGGSLVYRILEGYPVNWIFLRSLFDISGDLPPTSASLLVSIPSMFEEVAFRGILLTTFLNKYNKRNSIIYSALGFGLIHLLNLVMGRELIWVLGQVIWAFCIGLFYGYIFVRTRSLLPLMIIHYLGNVFISSFTAYLQAQASIEMQTLYGVIFSQGIVPTVLMIVWARFFINRWMPKAQVQTI